MSSFVRPVQFDVASIFLAAQQARANELAMRRAEEENFVRGQLPGAHQAAAGGDLSELYRLAPQEALAFREHAVDAEAKRAASQQKAAEFQQGQAEFQQKQQAQQQALGIDLQKRTSQVQSMVAQQIGADPRKAQVLQGYVDRLAGAGQIERFDVVGGAEPGNVMGPPSAAMAGGVEGMSSEAQLRGAAAGVQPEKRSPTSIEEKLLAEGLTPGTPEAQRRARELNERGGITINNGGELTSATQTGQQGAVIKSDQRLAQMAEMRAAIKDVGGYDAFASLFASGKGRAQALGSRLGIDVDKEALAKRARVEAAIGGFTNPIISELAGANVPDAEMSRMVQSLPTVDDAGPVLKAKIDAWERNTQLLRQHGVDYLVNGIRTGSIKLPGESQKPAASTPQAKAAAARQKIEAAVSAGEITREDADAIIAKRGL